MCLKSIVKANFFVKRIEHILCPICKQDSLKVNGRRERIVLISDGSKTIYLIERLKCEYCGKIHHVLPDFIVPYKRYSRQVIEKIISDDTSELACEDSTIRRIRRWYFELETTLKQAFVACFAKVGQIPTAEPVLKEIVRTLVNSNLWPSTCSAFSSA